MPDQSTVQQADQSREQAASIARALIILSTEAPACAGVYRAEGAIRHLLGPSGTDSYRQAFATAHARLLAEGR